MVKFLFFVHTITEAKQSNRQHRARLVDPPARSFDLARPGVAPPLGISDWTQSHNNTVKPVFFVCTISRISRSWQVRENNGPWKFEYSSVSV